MKIQLINEANAIQRTIQKIVSPVKAAFDNAVAKYNGKRNGISSEDYYRIELMDPDQYEETEMENGDTLKEVVQDIDKAEGSKDRTRFLMNSLYGDFAKVSGMTARFVNSGDTDTDLFFDDLKNAKNAASDISGDLTCSMYVFHYELDHYDKDGYGLYQITLNSIFYNGRKINGIADSYRWPYM